MKKYIALIVTPIIIIGLGLYFYYKPPHQTIVKIGYLPIVADFATFVAKDTGLFEKNGVHAEFVKLPSSNDAYNALAKGDIDYMSEFSFLPALLNDPKDPGVVKITSHVKLTPSEKFDQFIVKKESPINSLKDLYGKKVGLFPGTTQTTYFKIFLKKNGLDPEKITYVQIPPQNQLQALEAGSIDALGAIEPNATIALSSGNYKVIQDSVYARIFNENPLAGTMVNSKYAKENPQIVKAILDILMQAQDMVKKDRSILSDSLVKELKIEKPIADKVNISYLYPVEKNILEKFINEMVTIGELKQNVPVGDVTF